MNVHNMMEEIITKHINDLYDNIKSANSAWLTCDCKNCRLDTISYVLNRIPPKYVVSGRGVTHSAEILKNNQLLADINALGLDGIRIISSTKRPFHTLPREECEPIKSETPSFNFPTFSGTILDGNTFEPVSGATITLKENGNPVSMIDMTWANPTTTYFSTKGTFTFWAKPLPAETIGISKQFNFKLDIEADGYENTSYNFEVPIISEAAPKIELNSVFSLRLKEIVMFKKEIAEENF